MEWMNEWIEWVELWESQEAAIVAQSQTFGHEAQRAKKWPFWTSL